jgi:hypothetical protein
MTSKALSGVKYRIWGVLPIWGLDPIFFCNATQTP